MTSYPAGFATYTLPTDGGSANAGTPEISEYTRQGTSGDTISICAEGTPTSFVFSDGIVSSPLAGTLQIGIDKQYTVTIPAGLSSSAMITMWAYNANGFGTPVAINATQGWWVGHATVAEGDTFRVYGENVGADLYDATSDTWLVATYSDPYRAEYTVPSGWAHSQDGVERTIYSHNGKGRKYGWSHALTVNIETARTWSDNPSLMVDVTDEGAVGDGVTDDTTAINVAIAKAKNDVLGTKTVYFPNGTYLVSGQLLFNSSDMRIKGESMTGAIIKPYALIDPYPMINIAANRCAIEDITISTGGYGDYNSRALFVMDTRHLLRCTRMKLDVSNISSAVERTFMPENSSRIYMDNCELNIARSPHLAFCDDVEFVDCDFIGWHDSNNLIGTESSRTAWIRCTGTNENPEEQEDTSSGWKWANGRFIAGGVRGWNNSYIGQCTTTRLRPRLATPWVDDAYPVSHGTPVLFKVDPNNEVNDIFHWALTFPNGTLTREDKDVFTLSLSMWSDVVNGGAGGYTGYHMYSYEKATETIVIEISRGRIDQGFITETPPYQYPCRFTDIPDQNASEQVLFEGGNTSFRGVVTSATASTVTITGYSSEQESAEMGYVTIVQGRGLGQQRKILSNSGDIITVAEDWRVIPDSTSRVTVGRYCSRFVMYDNNIGSVDQPNDYSASTGFQITGSGHSIIIDGNTIDSTRTGLTIDAQSQQYWDGKNAVNPVMFSLLTNNTCASNVDGISMASKFQGSAADYPDDVQVTGVIFRDNTFSTVHDTGISITAENGTEHMGVNVYERNLFTDAETAITQSYDTSPLTEQVWIGNTEDGVEFP